MTKRPNAWSVKTLGEIDMLENDYYHCAYDVATGQRETGVCTLSS